MTSSSVFRMSVWLVPIVVVVCALMVVPTSAAIHSPSGTRSASGDGSAAAASTGGGGASAKATDLAGTNSLLHLPSLPTSGLPGSAPTQASLATRNIQSGIQRLVAEGANPATIQMLERTEASMASGAVSPHAVYLPNFNIFAHPQSTPKQAVSLYYTATPAPMGIGDFGLGTSTYTFNTSAVLGTAVLDSYNATAGSLYEATGSYYWNGFAANAPGNPYQSGMQLNTVLANVTFPGSAADPLGSGVFWTQNVPDFEGNTIQFIDNVWNMSASGASMNPGTLYSYDGVLVPYEFYYAYGPTIPAVFPLTMQLYNNASVNFAGQDVLTYGYRVSEPGAVYTGIYDTIVFNSPSGSTLGLPPEFRVDGNSTTPAGANFDSELVFTGPGAGSNAVITNVTGQLSMSYLSATDTWVQPVSAYDYGANTGETAIGVASTWSGTTVNIVQGPSLLYGLWGTLGGAPSGSMQFAGPSDPNYAFTFIGEAVGAGVFNLAWAPSNASGWVSTFLPPAPPVPYTAYAIYALADEYGVYAAHFSTAQADYPITLPSAPGTLDAPLYMNGEAQATALVTAIDGAATAPYTFANLSVALDPLGGVLFNLLNDWEFTTFNLFQAQWVTTPLVVDNVSQGPNVGGFTEYYYPYYGGYIFDLPNASQEFVDYGGVGDQFLNLNLPGFVGPAGVALGGAISLWATVDVTVDNVNVTAGSYGVWASTTEATDVMNSVSSEAAVFSVIASAGAVGENLSTSDYGVAVLAQGSSDALFSYLSASGFLAFGINGFWMNGTTASYLSSSGNSWGAEVQGGSGLYLSNVAADDSAGVMTSDVNNIVANFVSATNNGFGLGIEYADGLTASNLVASNGATDLFAAFSSNGNVGGGTCTNQSTCVGLLRDTGFTVSSISASFVSVAVEVINSTGVTVTGATATDQSIGVILDATTDVSVSDTTVSDLSLAVAAGGTTMTTIAGVTATNSTLTGMYGVIAIYSGPISAVVSIANTMLTVSDVTTSLYEMAFFDEDSNAATVSSVIAVDGEYAVVLNGTTNSLFTGINASADWQGFLAEAGASHNTITGGTFLDDTSYGVVFAASAVDNTVFENNFQGDNGATDDYSAAHIQAWSYGTNAFNSCSNPSCSSGVGNWWADWHTYGANGNLAPYPITGAVWDYFPLGGHEGTVPVYFYESGLAPGTVWTVNLCGPWLTCFTATTASNWTVFYVLPGAYHFAVDSVTGYSLAPQYGDLDAIGAPVSQHVSFTATYGVVVTETGLSASALASGWSATVAGVMVSGTTPALNYSLGSGTYAFQVTPVPGYTAAPSSGQWTVVNGTSVLTVAFTPVTYEVMVAENGLSSGTSWTATVNGNTLVSTGSSITFYLPDGTYTVQVTNVSGYSVSSANVPVTVNGAPAGASVSFTPTSTTSVVSTSTFDTWLAVAIAIAVVALVVAVVALFLRRGRREPPATGAQAWSPPPAAAQAPTSGTPPPSDSSTWSEGPPPGGSPPS